MQWANNERGYGWLTIILHWIGVIGVVLMFTIGLRAEGLEEAGDEAGHRAAMMWHVSIGAILFVFLLARVIQHYAQKQPAAPPQPRAFNVIAWISHNGLLLAILLLILSGPLMIWTAGQPVNVFDAVSIPSPFARNRALHEAFETVHAIGRYMLWVLVPLHVLGALKHLIVDRDGVFSRIFAPKGG